MISLSGYGQDGPWKDYSAYGMGLEPASGISSMTGYRGRRPAADGISFTDPYSGMVGAGAVLAALHYRRRTGKGQYIDLSEHEAAVPVVGYALMEQAMNGRLPERIGNRSHWYAPQGVLPVQGRRRLARDHGPERRGVGGVLRGDRARGVGADRRFADVLARFENHDALDEAITSWARDQDQMEAMHPLQKAGVIAAAVLSPKQVLLDPHLKERGYFDVIEQPGVGKKPIAEAARREVLGVQHRTASAGAEAGRAQPGGAQGLLGLSDDEVARSRNGR